MPNRSHLATSQFNTRRIRIIKIAVRVVEMKTQSLLSLPKSCADQTVLPTVEGPIPRFEAVPTGHQHPKHTRRQEPAHLTYQNNGSNPVLNNTC
ncbi:hypothetical protein ROS1_57440 [Roseibium sp. ROS1]